MRILWPIVWVGCGGPTTTGDAPADHTGTPPTFTLSGDLVVTDDANMAYEPEWQLAASNVRANTEIYLSWDTKTQDAWGAPRAADSFDELVLWEVSGSRAQTLDALAADDLEPLLAGTWRTSVAGETSARLSDLGFDAATDLNEDAGTSWLLALVDVDGGRTDVRDGMFMIPMASELGIQISFPLTTNHYTWTMRFGNDELRTDEGKDRYTIDWSALTVDSYGKAFDAARVDEVFVGRFDDVAEADDLGAELLVLSDVASGWWTVSPTGTSAVLSDARDAAGGSFPGFEADTSWLVGGRCTTCTGPAPMWLTVVEVRRP
ncbi:MAG: hypothetical protein H6738_14875 [Alphaproteobacteria bacterium]|nr:hypothetical protein [Alphaproteobacteria bacterium]MCB9698060.1 hypothetical protein [Alphaproteobacteria bacterium]